MYLLIRSGLVGFFNTMIKSALFRVYRRQRYGRITPMTTTIQSTISEIFMVDNLSKYSRPAAGVAVRRAGSVFL